MQHILPKYFCTLLRLYSCSLSTRSATRSVSPLIGTHCERVSRMIVKLALGWSNNDLNFWPSPKTSLGTLESIGRCVLLFIQCKGRPSFCLLLGIVTAIHRRFPNEDAWSSWLVCSLWHPSIRYGITGWVFWRNGYLTNHLTPIFYCCISDSIFQGPDIVQFDLGFSRLTGSAVPSKPPFKENPAICFSLKLGT